MSRLDDNSIDETSDAPSGSFHAYSSSAMAGDYLRSAAGLVPSGILLAVGSVGTIAAVVLGGFAALFGIFGLRTLLRHATRIEMTAQGVRAVGPRPQTILWSELDRLRLAYYSTRRDRKSGWMQLELGAGHTRLRMDSRIEGFEELVRRAALAAMARGVALSEATATNLEALGIRPGLEGGF
ncbi:MAG TPA: hypothetical protein VHU15_16090 [Stellaceae bacterium]|nr:hypothetical protein [Stellaceae bacterium]